MTREGYWLDFLAYMAITMECGRSFSAAYATCGRFLESPFKDEEHAIATVLDLDDESFSDISERMEEILTHYLEVTCGMDD